MVWSGLWNLTGVLVSSGAVAFGIVALLPVELEIKRHMTYAQGASAEMVAYATIQAADHLGLPVSTTQVRVARGDR